MSAPAVQYDDRYPSHMESYSSHRQPRYSIESSMISHAADGGDKVPGDPVCYWEDPCVLSKVLPNDLAMYCSTTVRDSFHNVIDISSAAGSWWQVWHFGQYSFRDQHL